MSNRTLVLLWLRPHGSPKQPRGHSQRPRRSITAIRTFILGRHSHEHGKTHLAVALGYEACLKGHSVLFTSAMEIINTLSAAKSAGRLKQEMKKYTKPSLLIMDELGYLPIDKSGADLLFQVISGRYEHGSTLITSNRAFKDWPKIFNNDSTLTAALLDRLLHHAETVVIEGKSYRMKGKLDV